MYLLLYFVNYTIIDISFKYLRRLSLSKMTTSYIEPDMFMNFTIDMEELQITGSDIKTVKAHAFKHIHGLKYLDLSDNVISTLDSDAFKEVLRIHFNKITII